MFHVFTTPRVTEIPATRERLDRPPREQTTNRPQRRPRSLCENAHKLDPHR